MPNRIVPPAGEDLGLEVSAGGAPGFSIAMTSTSWNELNLGQHLGLLQPGMDDQHVINMFSFAM